MQIRKEDLLTNNLDICENCEFAINSEDSKFLRCLLSGEEKGLVQRCNKFKEKTGNHISM